MEEEGQHGEVSIFNLWFDYLANILFLAIGKRMLHEYMMANEESSTVWRKNVEER